MSNGSKNMNIGNAIAAATGIISDLLQVVNRKLSEIVNSRMVLNSRYGARGENG